MQNKKFVLFFLVLLVFVTIFASIRKQYIERQEVSVTLENGDALGQFGTDALHRQAKWWTDQVNTLDEVLSAMYYGECSFKDAGLGVALNVVVRKKGQ